MLTIQICMGSACHLKGAPLIAQAFQNEIERLNKEKDIHIELIGSFCQYQCTEGVIVKIAGETYTHVTTADVPHLMEKILANI